MIIIAWLRPDELGRLQRRLRQRRNRGITGMKLDRRAFLLGVSALAGVNVARASPFRSTRRSGQHLTFVLVSGAWHGAWCWQRLVPLLRSRGHRVIAPDLLGMGRDPTPIGEVTLSRWVDQIVELIAAEKAPVILVGHSRGGIIISEVAERIPERIDRLVYLTAFLLPANATLATFARALPNRVPATPIQGGSVLNLNDAIERFYNTTPKRWIEVAQQSVGPEPTAPSNTALKISEHRFGLVPRAYIECRQDKAIPLSVQRSMQRVLPCNPVIALNTDHSPFLSAPRELAHALEAIGRGG